MAFILRGNARELRFTGEVRALGEPSPASELGRPRVRRSPASVRPPLPEATVRVASARAPSVAPAPRAPLPPPRAPLPAPRSPLMPRTFVPHELVPPRIEPDADDDLPTTAMLRDDILPGALRPPRAPEVAAPIPHFRAGAGRRDAPTVVIPRRLLQGRERGRLPLGAWLVAAIVAGAISFHFAPDLAARTALGARLDLAAAQR